MSVPETGKQQFDARRLVLPLVVLCFALLLRVVGLGWGLKNDLHNQSYHPDEEVNYRVSRLIEPAKLHFTPGFYNYGTLYLTSLRVAGDMAGAYGGRSDNPDWDWDFIRRCELAGRIISVICGSLACLTIFFAARRVTSDWGAFAAGLMLAISPALVVHAHFATVDTMALLFVCLALLYALKLLADEEPAILRWAILGGVCAGLSAGTKYIGGLSVVMPLMALVLRRPPKLALGLVACSGATVLAFVVSTPGCLLDTRAFVRDFLFEQHHAATGHGIVFVGTAPGILYHASNLILGMGLLAFFLGVGALVWAGLQRLRWSWVLWLFIVLYGATICSQQVKFMRYVFPLMPAIAVGIGYAVGEGHIRGRGYKTLVALGILGIGGLAKGGLRGTVPYLVNMASQDARDQAAVWIKAKSSDNTVVGLVSDPWFYTPPLYPDTAMVRMIPFRERIERMFDATRPRVVAYIPPPENAVNPWDDRLLTSMKPEYVVFSEYEREDIDRLATMGSVPDEFSPNVERYKEFVTDLQANYEQVAVFGTGVDVVEDMRHVVPTIYVWRRKG